MKTYIVKSTAVDTFLVGDLDQYGFSLHVIHILERLNHNKCTKDESRFIFFDITSDKKLPPVSEAVFVRNITTECGITPHRLIRHLRIEYAGYIARLSELTEGQVTTVCGFNDSRIFANILLKESFL
jgi:hypothetical protein